MKWQMCIIPGAAIMSLMLTIGYGIGDKAGVSRGYVAGYKDGQASQLSNEAITKSCVAWWFGQEQGKALLVRHRQAQAAYCKGGV